MGGIVSGILKIGGNIISGSKKKKASKKAQAALEAAQAQVRDTVNTNTEKVVDLYDPYSAVGKIGLDRLTSAYASGDPSSIILAGDPGYAFRKAEGEKSVQRAAAAKGGYYSGAQLKALTSYDQNIASEEYGNAYNRVLGLAGIGRSAADAKAGAYNSGTSMVAQSLLGTGQAQAQGALERGAISAATWSNSINDGIQAIESSIPGIGGAGGSLSSLASIFKKKAA